MIPINGGLVDSRLTVDGECTDREMLCHVPFERVMNGKILLLHTLRKTLTLHVTYQCHQFATVYLRLIGHYYSPIRHSLPLHPSPERLVHHGFGNTAMNFQTRSGREDGFGAVACVPTAQQHRSSMTAGLAILQTISETLIVFQNTVHYPQIKTPYGGQQWIHMYSEN